ncbi:winged helix-turn-helix transcriptional regulator [Ilumatobacter nonamiensis]|uniref:winged helix-turn-helix transcriptional regulator n=1 Tax=Ilumatobacter nonamiensis TaxID=467093 RepID=UPI00058CD23D|nr:helix-turn-helix domain-containing protein [Ilumatobacter nonamiensis]
MRRASFADMHCSVARALDVVGDPWTLLVMRDLFRGHHRFEEFHNSLGIARNTLTSRLNTLVAEGVVERREYQARPPRFEYHLTTKGRAFNGVVIALMKWGDEWSGFDEPPVHLIDDDTGKPIDPVLVDRRTGTPLTELRVRTVASD